jgi:ABC-type Mn2+/Zn2+ transport system ATPase subunit
MLELKDATLTINGRRLFANLSLMAQDGQMTCITGGAGSGKTALVEVMLGLLPLDEGMVSVDGELLTPLSAPTFRRMMAYVPQQQKVELNPKGVDTIGLETVWSPFNRQRYKLTIIDELLDIEPMASKPIVIADDPEPKMLSMLKSLATGGHTVIVTSTHEEYIRQSDKTITLENHDTVNY